MKVFFSSTPFFRTVQGRLWPSIILALLWSSSLHAQQAPSLPRDLYGMVAQKAIKFDPPTGTRADLSGMVREDTLEAIRIFSGHEGGVNVVGFSPDGTRIITGSEDQTVREWDMDTGEGHTPFEGHEGAIKAAFYAPDGTTVWSAATDSKVIVRTSDGEVFWEAVFPLPVYSLKLSRDATKMLVGTGTYLVAWPPRPSVYFYDIETGGPPVHVLGETNGAGYYVAADYSPTEDKIVTGFLGFLSGDAILWDAVTGTSLYKLGYSNIRDAVFSPNGTQVLTASDNEANLWDVQTGEHIRTFAGHAADVNAVDFSPGGTVIVTGSSDQTVRLWNTSTGELLQTLIGHTASVNDVTFSPDGMYLSTAASDSTARLWATDLGDDELAPRSPTGLTAIPGNSEVALTWNPNPEDDITEYRLYRDTAPSPATPVVTIPANTETFTDTGLVNGTVYYYRLTAVNTAGVESGFSEEVRVVVAMPGTTVIIHGHRGVDLRDNGIDVDQEWTLTMAQGIVKRSGKGEIYVIGCGKQLEEAEYGNINNHLGCGGDIVRRPKLLENVADTSSDGETVIVFDWLEESNEPILGAFGHAEAAADALVARLIDGAQQEQWSLERLHFIGHSRGTVVASEAIQRLGWYSQTNGKIGDHAVDQGIHLTTLDPHPWDKVLWDQIGDPGSADDHDVNDFSDANVIFRGSGREKLGVVCWNNVAYCDNYYQNDGLADRDIDEGLLANWTNLNGMPDVPGIGLNTELTSRFNMDHGNVHTWYHGTILYSAENDDYLENTDGPVCNDCGSEIEFDWYPTDVLERSKVGYNYSLRGGGQAATESIRSKDNRPIIIQDESIMERLNIFNGDFEFNKGNHKPGWEFQGGSGDGNIDSDEGDSGTAGSTPSSIDLAYHLTLHDGGFQSHNWLYIPEDEDRIWFQKRLVQNSGEDYLNVDLIREGEELEFPSSQLQIGLQWEWDSIQIPQDFAERRPRFDFDLKIVALNPMQWYKSITLALTSAPMRRR